MKPDVSIIIPTYNRSEFVLDAVRSAVNQSYREIEVLVVDDGSDPQPLSEIEAIVQHADVKGRARLIKQPHLGQCAARNRGFQESQGEFIQFLDSDDLLHPRKIEVQKNVLIADATLGMSYCLDEYFLKELGDFGILWNAPSSEFHLDRFAWDDPVWNTGSPLWRRSAFESIGMWKDELSAGYDDWELHIRAICKGINYVFVPLVLQFVRDHQQSRITESAARLEKSKSIAVPLAYDCLNEHKCNSVLRSDGLCGMLLFSADILMKEGFNSDADKSFGLALKYASSMQMRFLSSVMNGISFSNFVYRLLVYPFRRLLRRRLYQRRGNWKIIKGSDVNKANDSNIQTFLSRHQKLQASNPVVSIIISTHNGESRLKSTLSSHLQQNAPPESYEIILVDNASTDKTREFVTSISVANPQLRYVYEKNLGLHNARHAGARAAKGEILLFTDDDASVDSNWVNSYLKVFGSHPAMVAAGGSVKPKWQETPEEWLMNLVQTGAFFPALGLIDLFPNFRLSPDGPFFGVNMAIKKDHIFQLGGFNPESFGDRWLGDGESGLLHKLWLNGMHIGFVPDARVYHHIPSHRMRIEYLNRWARNWGASDAYGKYSECMPSRSKLIRDFMFLIALNLPKSLLILLKHGGRQDPVSVHRIMGIHYSLEQIRYVFNLITSATFRKFVLHKDWLNQPPSGQGT